MKNIAKTWIKNASFELSMQVLDSKFSENIVREPHDYSLKLQVVIAFQEPAAIPADEACDIIRWLTTDMFSVFDKCI